MPANTPEFLEIQSQPAPLKPRWYVIVVAMGAVLGVLLIRSFWLQVVSGNTFLALAEDNRVSALPVPAPRGLLYGASGEPLMENITHTDLLLDPALLPAREEEGFLIEALTRLLPSISSDRIREALTVARERRQPVVLARGIDHETVLALEQAGPAVSGIRFHLTLVRNYLHAEETAHVIGYTAPASAEELVERESLLPSDSTGKTGVEKVYEEQLAGVPGLTYSEVNVAGRPQKALGEKAPVGGEDVQLTLDIDLQKFITDLFREQAAAAGEAGKPSTAGAAVVMNPKSGEILALVSFPTFDPNVFSQTKTRGEAIKIFEHAGRPLFNRATDGMYPPGSTIKPFLAAAALDMGLITDQTQIVSTGGISVGPWRFPDWQAGGHGITDVYKAVAESVNTFFYAITGGYEEQVGLGVAKATEYLARFGWGQVTGADVGGEADGFLPSEAWKEEIKNEAWYIGDTYHLGIGQGDVLVTPLQMAAGTAAIANGGHKITPHVSRTATGSSVPIEVGPQALEIVRRAMRETVLSGSGRRLSTLPIAVAGKTGTAQVGGSEDTHAWFTSYGPFERPEIVVTVLLERAGEGDKVAVPFAEKIWKWWIENRITN